MSLKDLKASDTLSKEQLKDLKRVIKDLKVIAILHEAKSAASKDVSVKAFEKGWARGYADCRLVLEGILDMQ